MVRPGDAEDIRRSGNHFFLDVGECAKGSCDIAQLIGPINDAEVEGEERLLEDPDLPDIPPDSKFGDPPWHPPDKDEWDEAHDQAVALGQPLPFGRFQRDDENA